MPQFLRSVAMQARVIAAAGEVNQIDLPVNPLTCLIITIRALNNVPSLATHSALAGLFAKFSNMNVRYRGASIVDGDALDLAVMYAILSKWLPHQGQVNRVDNDVRSITFPILFGRRPYDVKECFPATRRGDLIFQWTALADAAPFDNFQLQVETVELLDAVPERFLKVTNTQRVITLGDTNDIDLPIGNKLLGLLLKGVTFPTAALRTASFARNRIELDNVEVMYSRTTWDAIQGEMGRVLIPGWAHLSHIHGYDGASAGIAESAEGTQDVALAQQYAYMDLDPTGDLQFALDTTKAADVTLGVDSDVTDATPSRVIIPEYVQIPGGAAAG